MTESDQPPPAEAFARYWKCLPLFVFLLALTFLAVHLDLKPVLGDEGITYQEALRVLSGQVPHRDFFELIPPFSFYIPAAWFRAFGASVLSGRLLGQIYGVALLVGCAFLAWRHLKNPVVRSVPLALLVPFGIGVWPFPSHHWLVDILQVFALLCLARSAERGGVLPWALAGGALLGLGVLTLQDQGGYAILGALAAGLAIRGRTARWRFLGGTIGGAFAASLPIGVPLLIQAGPLALFRDWVLFPLTAYGDLAANRVGFLEGWRQILSQWDPDALRIAPAYASSIALASMLVYALPVACPLALLAAWRRRWLPPAELALLAAFCLAFLGTAFHRWSLMNLIWAAPLPAAGVALALDRGWTSPSRLWRWGSRAATLFLLLCLCGFGILRIALVRTGTLHPVLSPAGSYRTFDPMEARDLQELVDAVGVLVPPGAPAFCKGYLALASFMTQHPNPTPYTVLVTPSYNTESQARQWVSALERGRVEWGFGVGGPDDPADGAARYLRERYLVVWQNRSYRLWRRVEGAAPGPM